MPTSDNVTTFTRGSTFAAVRTPPESPEPGDAHRIIVPYITAWSTEVEPPYKLVERPGGGIAYRDETLADRDRHGVLWLRTPFRPRQGRPVFGDVHPLRQRRAMQRLLCQVCAGPANRTDEGVLWLLRDHRSDWRSWPEGMGVTEPPICVECVRLSVRMCPALRRGAVLVRVRSFPISAVRGVLYGGSPVLGALREETICYEDPARFWLRAACMVRELRDCTILPPTELDLT